VHRQRRVATGTLENLENLNAGRTPDREGLSSMERVNDNFLDRQPRPGRAQRQGPEGNPCPEQDFRHRQQWRWRPRQLWKRLSRPPSKVKNQKSKAKIHKPRLDRGFQPMQPRNPLAAKLYDISKRIFRKNSRFAYLQL